MWQKIWKFLNGKKRVIGSLILIAALGLRLSTNPEHAKWAPVVEQIGYLLGGSLLGVGMVHGEIKRQNQTKQGP